MAPALESPPEPASRLSCLPIETIGVPFPSANEITLEMICNAMMQVKSNKSMTAYQCYIQDTADLRDMKGFDLPATILSSVSSLDTPY